MKFEEVLPAFREGKKIRRGGWPELTVFTKVRSMGDVGALDSCDIYANDWEVVEEPKKPMVFEGVVSYGYCSDDGRPDRPAYSDSFDRFILAIVHPCKYKKWLKVTVEELGPNKEKGEI